MYLYRPWFPKNRQIYSPNGKVTSSLFPHHPPCCHRFLQEINKSLQDQGEVSDVLEQFEREIRCCKCQLCGKTFLGSERLSEHISVNHKQNPQIRIHEDLPSLGDCLNRLKNNLDHCINFTTKPSAMISQQSFMISKLLTHQETMRKKDKICGNKSTVINFEDDTPYKFKCKACSFEADSPTLLDNHIVAIHNQVQCAMCNNSNSSGTKVTKHVEETHPESSTPDVELNHNQVQCPMCSFSDSTWAKVTKHVEDKHPESSTPDEQPSLLQCPLCNYSNSTENNISEHVQNKHPEQYSCNKCEKVCSSKSDLENHSV